jgi:MurNAc alpha-1-phosphate uridylyltransferase
VRTPRSTPGLAGVVLAAGLGERLRPLTTLRPKALCPVANVPLLDLAMNRLRPYVGTGPASVAVNAHHFAPDIVRHVGDRAHVQVEEPVPLGTAGALGQLRGWLDGRDVLLTNADAYTPCGLAELVNGWDGTTCRLLATPVRSGQRADFVRDGVGVKYVGSCLLPWTSVRGLAPEPSGLYEVLWRDLRPSELELVVTDAAVIDCGRPVDYLAANLHASAGASVVGPGAVIEGRLERSVVWPGAYVGPREHLVEVVRAGTRAEPLTVPSAGG